MQRVQKPLRVLIIEDAEDDAMLLLRQIRKGGYDPAATRVETLLELRNAMSDNVRDVIISDHNLPDFNSITALGIAYCNDLVSQMPERNQDEINQSINRFTDCLNNR